jgi:hypothetical protein
MIKSAADLILGVWNTPEVPLRVEYPLDIMEELRSLVCEDLQRLSRGGTDPAGLLFGISRGPAVRILTWRPISRASLEEQGAHSALHDRAELVRVLSSAATDPEMRGLEPLGWFVSRAQGGTGLTAPEVELYNNFFPNSWQFTLLVRRGPGGTARAGFFARDATGYLRADASFRELLIQPVRRLPGALEPSASRVSVPDIGESSRPLTELRRENYPAFQRVSGGSVEQVASINAAPVEAPIPDPRSAIEAPERRSSVSEPLPTAAAPLQTPVRKLFRTPDQPPAAAFETPLDPSTQSAAAPIEAPAPAANGVLQSEPLDPERASDHLAAAPIETPAPALNKVLDAEPRLRQPDKTPNQPAAAPIQSAPPVSRTVSPEARNSPPVKTQQEPVFAPIDAAIPAVDRPLYPEPPRLDKTPNQPVASSLKTSAPVFGRSLFGEPPDTEPDKTPSFVMQATSFGGARWLWIFPILLAAAGIVFLVTQKTRETPIVPFSLRVAMAGPVVEISWDRDSMPVWNGDHASIKIQDGSDTKQISLTSAQLREGSTHYVRESSDVSLLMTIYDSSGRSSQEFARLVALPASAPEPASAPASGDSTQLRSERDDLQNQVQELRGEIRKEAARADQAESVVKILENRLKIRPDDPIEKK